MPAVSCRYAEASVRWMIKQGCGDSYPDIELDFLPINFHIVYLECADNKPPVHDKEGRGSSTDADTDANSGTRRVRRPLLVGELCDETALAYGRVSD